VIDALALLDAAANPDCERERVEMIAFPLVALTLLHVASDLARYASGSRLSSAAALAAVAGTSWCALALARQFAALHAAQRRQQVQPFFDHLPSAEELLVRVEYLCGGVLLTFSQATHSRVPDEDGKLAPVEGSKAEATDDLRLQLSKLERWLDMHASRVACSMEAVWARQGSPESSLGTTASDTRTGLVTAIDMGADATAAPCHQQRLHAAVHFDRSIRMLPKALRRGGVLLNQMMLVLSTALVEAAASLVEHVDSGKIVSAESCSTSLETVADADEHLSRSESLADAAGYQAVAAVVQANRAHLRSLAADMLVSRALASSADLKDIILEPAEIAALQALDSCDNAENGEDGSQLGPTDPGTLGLCVGRLGDRAMSLALAAHASVDSVIEPDAASALAMMSTGTLLAIAARLRALPPPDVSDVEYRRTAASMITRALQFLPQSHHVGSHSEARLCAHAHLMQCEIIVETQQWRGESQQRQHRIDERAAWHLERARAALHGAADAGDGMNVLIAHLHVVHSRLLLGQAGVAGGNHRRQAEQAVEGLMAGCRSIGFMRAPTIRGDSSDAAAWDEVSRLLLQRLQVVLRELCTREVTSSGPCRQWKDLYRAALQAAPTAVSSLCTIYESVRHKDD